MAMVCTAVEQGVAVVLVCEAKYEYGMHSFN